MTNRGQCVAGYMIDSFESKQYDIRVLWVIGIGVLNLNICDLNHRVGILTNHVVKQVLRKPGKCISYVQ